MGGIIFKNLKNSETNNENSTSESEVSKTDSTSEREVSKTDSTSESEISKTDSTSESEVSKTDSTSESEVSKTDSTSESEVSKKDSTSENKVSKKDSTSENEASNTDLTSENEASNADSTPGNKVANTVSTSGGEVSNADSTSGRRAANLYLSRRILAEVNGIANEIYNESITSGKDVISNAIPESGSTTYTFVITGRSSNAIESLENNANRSVINETTVFQQFQIRQISNFCLNYSLMIDNTRRNILSVIDALTQELEMLSCFVDEYQITYLIDILDKLYDATKVFEDNVLLIARTEVNAQRLVSNVERFREELWLRQSKLMTASNIWRSYYD